MTTKTCTNGHIMTGIGFGECPECEAPWIATPTVKDIILSFVQDLCIGEENKRRAVVTISEALTIYGQSRYEAGVKAEATRRDGIEHAIEQSIIDHHVSMAVKAERAKVESALNEAKKTFDEWTCKATSCSDPLCGHSRCVNDMYGVFYEKLMEVDNK